MLLPYQQTMDAAAIRPSSHQPFPVVSPEGTQGGDKLAAHCPALSHCGPHPYPCAPWGDSGWESTGYWPQRAEVLLKGMISLNSDSCIFPYLEKR